MIEAYVDGRPIALRLQFADEGRFGVSRGRLGLVTDRFEVRTSESIVLCQFGESGLFLFVRCFGVVTSFDVDLEETGELNVTSGRPKLGLVRLDGDRVEAESGLGHL